jgi:hypothetical protein
MPDGTKCAEGTLHKLQVTGGIQRPQHLDANTVVSAISTKLDVFCVGPIAFGCDRRARPLGSLAPPASTAGHATISR